MNSEERWKDISRNEKYQISDFGRVRTIKTGRIRKLTVAKDEYFMVSLKNGYVTTTRSVARLVAMHFIEKPT